MTTLKELNRGFQVACHHGYLEVALSLMKKGANDFNGGLNYACQGGHRDLALLMLQNGADANCGLFKACQKGRINLSLLMVESGANNIDNALSGACWGAEDLIKQDGNFQDIEYQSMDDEFKDFRNILWDQYKALILLLIRKGATNWAYFELGREMKKINDES